MHSRGGLRSIGDQISERTAWGKERIALWYNLRKRIFEIDKACHNRRKEFILYEPVIYGPLSHYACFSAERYFEDELNLLDEQMFDMTIPEYVFFISRMLRETQRIYSGIFAKYLRQFAAEAVRQRKLETELYKTLKERLDNMTSFKKTMRE